MTITIGGTSITFNDSTTQSTAATGTVSSVATGNGLSGGTITSTGTLTIACPSYNTVGSYSMAIMNGSGSATIPGNNYAAGNGSGQVVSALMKEQCGWSPYSGNQYMSGTWKWMCGNWPNNNTLYGLCCRVA